MVVVPVYIHITGWIPAGQPQANHFGKIVPVALCNRKSKKVPIDTGTGFARIDGMSKKLAEEFAGAIRTVEGLDREIRALESKRDACKRAIGLARGELGKTVGANVHTRAYRLGDGRVLIVRFNPDSHSNPTIDILEPVLE